MNLELDLRARRWERRRTVDDRRDVLVIGRRAEALLLLARPRLVRVSWSAWLDSSREYSSGDTTAAKDPPPRLEALVRQAEALARGEAFYDGDAYWGGPPRSAMDPRLVVLDELTELLEVDREALDVKTHEIGQRIERMLAEAMDRMRAGAVEVEPAPARNRLGLPKAVVPPPPPPPPPPLVGLPRHKHAVCTRARLAAWLRSWHPAPLDETAGPERFEVQRAERDLLILRKALSGVARVGGQFYLPVTADLLIGHRSACLTDSGLDRVSTFGALEGHGKEWVVGVLNLCVREGLVEGLRLTDKGRAVMMGDEAVALTIPEEEPLSDDWEPDDTGDKW